MTEVTQFLAQLSGPVFLVVGLALLVNVSAFLKVAADAEKDDLENYLASIMLMVAGLAIVLYHNVWTDAPEVIISLLGWACLIKGIFWILLPGLRRYMIRTVVSNAWVILVGIVSLVLGLYLGWVGYFTFLG